MNDPGRPSPRQRDPHLLLEHDDFLRALARSLVSDAARADDVVQQTYAATLSNAAGPREPASLRAWLGSVVRNVAWKLRRSESRRTRHEQSAARPEALPSVADIVAREQTRRRVVEAVLTLEEPTRTTMLLRYFDRLPPRAIAKKLGVPVETVRTRIKRALERLRAELDRAHGGEHDADARAKWLAALAPFTKAAPGGAVAAAGAAAAGAFSSIGAGVLLMSAKVKVLSAAAVVTSAAVAWLVLHDDGADELANARAAAADHAASLAQPATSDAGGTPRPSSVEAARDLDAPLTPAPTPPLVDPAFATLLVHAKWARDGTPAADVGITLYAWARADHYVFLPESRTDAKGVARFERIEPGPVSMFGDRCGRLDVHVEAGKVTELELVLPDGMDLDGTVVDGAGLPVAGADVWLGFEGNQCDNGTIVAKSDARGRFAIACVSSDRNVGARKPGFEPSPLVFVGGNAGTSMHLTLTLGGRGGVVRGRVVGPDEQPVAGAIVQLGDEHTVIPRGTSFPYEMLLRTNSDADGRFEFTGAMNGERPIVVRSRELAPWIGRVTVDPDLPAELLIHLPAGATLEGKVVDAKSQPIGGTQIELDTPSRLASATGSSALDGTYRIVHVLPGTFAARAEHERSGAKAGTLLSLGDGATTRWDVTLASGLTLRGRVLDEDGRPYPGCWVVAQAVISARANGVIDDFFERNATCDKNGCFSIAGCPDAGLDIRVEPPDHGMTPAAILHGVRASEELVIHVPAERRCSAWFVGTVVGEDGAPLDNATVHVSSPLSQTCPIETVEAHTGRFRMGPYAPADSVVHIRADGYAETMIAADHVAKDEVRDLGTIRMERGAPITVRARDEAGAAPANAWIAIRVAGTDRYAAATSAGEGAAEVDRAAPGDYDVTVQAPGYVPAWKTVTVANGQPVLVEFTLRRGRAVTLRPSFSRELVDSLGSLGGGGREASALLRDADRRPLARYGVGELEAAAKAGWSCEISLLPGRYVLDLLLAGDTASTATFEVPAEGAASEIALSFE